MPNWRRLCRLLVPIMLGACATAPNAPTPVLVGVTPLSSTAAVPVTVGVGTPTRVPSPKSTGTLAGQFSIFLGALRQTGLVNRLRTGGPYTIFAPPNEVFDQMPEATRSALFQDQGRLTEVLEYHIVEGNYTPDILRSVSTLPTLQGESLKVTSG